MVEPNKKDEGVAASRKEPAAPSKSTSKQTYLKDNIRQAPTPGGGVPTSDFVTVLTVESRGNTGLVLKPLEPIPDQSIRHRVDELMTQARSAMSEEVAR